MVIIPLLYATAGSGAGTLDRHATQIHGCYLIQPKTFTDHRGSFTKLFHAEIFREGGLPRVFNQAHYSVSKKNVILGLHYLPPPNAGGTVITCVKGRVLKVIVDLRSKSSTFRCATAIELDPSQGTALFVPEGLAHGLLSLEDHSVVLSLGTQQNSWMAKHGINWKSIDFKWPVHDPIVSEEDQGMIDLSDFTSPF